MGKLTNGQCRELVAQLHDMNPEDLVGWVVIAIPVEGPPMLLSNAKDIEQVKGVLRDADQFLEPA